MTTTMIGDKLPMNPTIRIPPWDFTVTKDPTPPVSLLYDKAFFERLQRNPSNGYAITGDEEMEEFDVPAPDFFSCDSFRMFEFKVKRCGRDRSHDWTECPFAHPGEKAHRRDPRKYHYSGIPCPEFRRGACPRGDACDFAHGLFECWLHPARYRTQLCKDGALCRRRVCFFAHSPEQLRVLPHTTTDPLPISPVGQHSPSLLHESMRDLQLSRGRLCRQTLTISPPCWKLGFGSPRTGTPSPISGPAATFARLSSPTPWETPSSPEEPAFMERVESGKALREKLYAKLVQENSLNRVG